MRLRVSLIALAALACGAEAPEVVEPTALAAQPAPAAQVESAETSTGAPPDVLAVNGPGEEVGVDRLVVLGKVTVVEFYADWCTPCREIERRVLAMMSGNGGVALRKVNIGDDAASPVAMQHSVSLVPSVRIYDADGTLRYSLEGETCQAAAEIALHLSR